VRLTVHLGLLLLGACGAEPSGARPRNVLLITLDTTRADALSCYGSTQSATPNLDALAAEGTRFDLAISTAAVTPVAHAAILTGLDNHEHGLRVLYAEGGFRLGTAATTLAEVLAARGFRTLAVHSAFPVSRFFGLERGFQVFEDLQAEMAEHGGDFRWDVASFQRRSDETTDLASELLGDEPFFLWVHYWDPHDLAKLPPDVDPRAARKLPSPEITLYAAEVAYMDSQVGRLLGALRARGVYDDTLVLAVADHGQGLEDHGWFAHRLLYQEDIRVPLIVRVPGVRSVPAVPELVRTIDLYPTVLDYLGIEPPRRVSGRSLRPLLEGRDDAPRTALADQLNGLDWNAGEVRERKLDDFLYATVDRDWKLVYRPRHFAESELYQLSRDPREERNLFSARPEEARALLERLAEAAPWVTEPFEPLIGGPDADEARRALSELGYTGSAPLETEWEWTCPSHLDQRREERGPCPICGAAPLLIGR